MLIFLYYIEYSLQKVNSIHILGCALWQFFKSLVFVYINKCVKSHLFLVRQKCLSSSKMICLSHVIQERDLLKSTFRLDLRRNVLLYYLQVGGYRAEHFFSRSNFNEIMSFELFNHGIGLQLCINTGNFFHAAVCQFPWILYHDCAVSTEYLHTKFK